MSKALKSYPERDRYVIIERRIQSKTMGLGYWAAMDSKLPKVKKVTEEKK